MKNLSQNEMFEQNNKIVAEKAPFIAQAVNQLMGDNEFCYASINVQKLHQTYLLFRDNSKILMKTINGEPAPTVIPEWNIGKIAETAHPIVSFVCSNLYYIDKGVKIVRPLDWFIQSNLDGWEVKYEEISAAEKQKAEARQAERIKSEKIKSIANKISDTIRLEYFTYAKDNMPNFQPQSLWSAVKKQNLHKTIANAEREDGIAAKDFLKHMMTILNTTAVINDLPKRLQKLAKEIYEIEAHKLQNDKITTK